MNHQPLHFLHTGVPPMRLLPLILTILGGMLLGSCNVTKHLDQSKGERLLTKNSLELTGDKRLGFSKRTALQYELNSLFKQEPNDRPILLFKSRWRLWLYYKYTPKKSKFSKWILRKVAEPPTLYDDELTQKTATNLQNYMQQRGYFDARCNYETRFKGDFTASTTYRLNLGPLFTIDQTEFVSQDSNVQRILDQTRGRSRLKAGNAMDGREFEAEKLRIAAELKDRGYAFFVPNYVEFIGDSTGTKTRVTVEVHTEADSVLHQTYNIGHISVLSNLVPEYTAIRRDTTYNGMYFASSADKFLVKPEHLYNAIAIRPGELYRQEDFDKTQRRLNALGIFRFVSVRPTQDTLQPEQLNVAISFSPAKRLSIGGDLELNSSTSSVSGRLFGVASSLNARNRNLFHGAEQIVTNLQYNVEFDITNRDRPIFSQEFKIQNDLTFPRFIDHLRFWKGLHKIQFGNKRLLSTNLYNKLRSDGQTRLSLSYNYLDLINYYAYDLFNASFGYQLRSDPEHLYTFDNIGIDVLRPTLRPEFDTIFGQNEFLKRSFGNQLFTGFLMRSMTYTLTSKPNAFGERWFFRVNPELSGLEVYVLNSIWSAAFRDKTWRIADLEFSKYLRLDIDGSYTRDFTRELSAAFRIGSGMVVPFGDTDDVPYVKQFFVGGPSSIRAWRIRELGPGGYQDPNQPLTQPFYQAANFRFEFNGELRFPLFWWIKGAVFIDGGNIWTFRPDPNRPGAELRLNSYKNIALGTGFGFRGDFDFFIIRFDLGLKLRNPYRNEDGRYRAFDKWSDLSLRSLNPNISVGYPF